MKKLISLCLTAMIVAGLTAPNAQAAPKTSFRLAWSIYVGWMPWPYAAESGILKKWADKYGIAIDLVQINDYVESINQYTVGAFDGVVATNMDSLTIPAAGGVDSTAVIIGDYSNGNDAVIVKKGKDGKTPTLADLSHRTVYLVQLSVSQYLLSRALEAGNLKESAVTSLNTSDADIVAAFATPSVTAVATWNPQVSEILKQPGAVNLFDSAQIPGEILDLMVVNSATLKDNPKLGQALAGAWYEVMGLMTRDDAQGRAARAQMAKESGTDLAGFDGQLKTTHLFANAADATAFNDSTDLIQTMDRVRKFSFDHGLLGPNAASVDAIGIAFPGNQTLGKKSNIKLRFDDQFMQAASRHTL